MFCRKERGGGVGGARLLESLDRLEGKWTAVPLEWMPLQKGELELYSQKVVPVRVRGMLTHRRTMAALCYMRLRFSQAAAHHALRHWLVLEDLGKFITWQERFCFSRRGSMQRRGSGRKSTQDLYSGTGI